jgi:hypothetical protein
MRGAIEFTQKSLDGADKEIPTKEVFDFSFVQKAVMLGRGRHVIPLNARKPTS